MWLVDIGATLSPSLAVPPAQRVLRPPAMAKKRKSVVQSVEEDPEPKPARVDAEAVAKARERLASEGFGIGRKGAMWKQHELPPTGAKKKKRRTAEPGDDAAAAAPPADSLAFNFGAGESEADAEEDDEPQATAAAATAPVGAGDAGEADEENDDGAEEEGEEEEEEEDEEDDEEHAGGGISAVRGFSAERITQLSADLTSSIDGGVLGAAAALPDAAGMAAATLDSSGHALLDTAADASVRILDVLHRATQLYSAAVSESGAGAAALPGELDDTRFLKGLRLGPADKDAVTQYVEMGLWRRIGWLNQLAHAAAEEATATDESEAASQAAAASASAAEGGAQQPAGGFNFKQWYQEEYTAMLGDELDTLRQEAGFSARDVSALIGCIEGGSEILGSLEKTLATTQLRSPKLAKAGSS